MSDNLSDTEILLTLHCDGFQIAYITLERLQQQLGLRLHTDNPKARGIQEQQMKVTRRLARRICP